MDRTLDQTTIETISLLEARLLRIEQILFGSAAAPIAPAALEDSVVERITLLERDFSRLVSKIKAYSELLDLYDAQPALFGDGQLDPSVLPEAAVVATVLASAPLYSSFAPALTAAIRDHPVPEASHSEALVQLGGRIRAVRTTQVAQAAEAATLRARSEAAIRWWYEAGVLTCSDAMADAEGRLEKVEGAMRRRERAAKAREEY